MIQISCNAGDVINEYYGPKAAKNTVYIGLAMSMLVREWNRVEGTE